MEKLKPESNHATDLLSGTFSSELKTTAEGDGEISITLPPLGSVILALK